MISAVTRTMRSTWRETAAAIVAAFACQGLATAEIHGEASGTPSVDGHLGLSQPGSALVLEVSPDPAYIPLMGTAGTNTGLRELSVTVTHPDAITGSPLPLALSSDPVGRVTFWKVPNDQPPTSTNLITTRSVGGGEPMAFSVYLRGESVGPATLKIGGKKVQVTVLEIDVTKTSYSWLPKGGAEANSHDYTCTASGGAVKIKFSLTHVTSYLGYCSNAGDSLDPDLRFRSGQPTFDVSADGLTAVTTNAVSSATITVDCRDYGAYGRLHAEAVRADGVPVGIAAHILEDDGDMYDYVTIPRDETGTIDRKGNRIADVWDAAEVGTVDVGGNWSGGTWQTLYGNSEDAARALDVGHNNEPKRVHVSTGDAYSVLQEYRGFMFGSPPGWGGATGHKRLSAATKEVLVEVERMIGFPSAPSQADVVEALNSTREAFWESARVVVEFAVDRTDLPHELYPNEAALVAYRDLHRGYNGSVTPKYKYETASFLYMLFADKYGDFEGNERPSWKGGNIFCTTCGAVHAPIATVVSFGKYAGMVAAHELSHSLGTSDYTTPTYPAIQITYSPLSPGELVYIARIPNHANHIDLQLKPEGNSSLSLIAPDSDTLAELVARISAIPGYTATLVDATAGGLYSYSLQDFEGVPVKPDEPAILNHASDISVLGRDQPKLRAIIQPRFTPYEVGQMNPAGW